MQRTTSKQPAHLVKRVSKIREETTAKVLAALLSAGTGGLTIMEMVTLTGLSESCWRARVQVLHGEGKARVCDSAMFATMRLSKHGGWAANRA